MTAAHRPGSAGCRGLFERLSEYLDADLPRSPRAVIDDHLGRCEPCRAFLESLRRTVRLVESVGAAPLPTEVRRNIREAYRRLHGDR